MTEQQHALAQALGRCTFTPGSTAKRFVRWAASMHPTYDFSEHALAFLERLAHTHRRQLGRCMATDCAKCKPAIEAAKRTCPACGAKPGKPCRSYGRHAKRLKPRDPGLVHAARLEGAA